MRREAPTSTVTPGSDAPRAVIVPWAALSAVGLAATWLLLPSDTPVDAPSWVPLALVLLTVLAEGTELLLQHRRSREIITLLEVAVVVDVLLLPPGQAVAVVMGAIALIHIVRGRSAEKILFNVGMHGTGAAMMVTIVAIGGPYATVITPLRVLLTMTGVLVFGLVNVLAFGWLLASLEERPVREILDERTRFVVATLLGNGVVGIIAVALGTAYLWMVPLLLSPVLALHLTYRGVARTESLLAEVRSERDLLNRVLTGASDGIALVATDGTVQLWNPAMAQITGHAVDDAVGRSLRDLIEARDDEGAPVDPIAALGTSDQVPTVWSSDVVVQRDDGSKVDSRLLHTLLRDEDDQLVGDVVILRDLTREHEVRSLKQDFVARVSHELRTPLTPIRGYAQVLLKGGDQVDPVVREKGLTAIIERVTHMTRLIDDLLLAARVTANDPRVVAEIDAVPMDLVSRTKDIVAWFERDLPERRFELRAAPGLPAAHADPLRVGQILTNLITNACKYSEPHTPVVVEVSQLDPRTLCVDVVDEGIGIPDEELDRIFEQFHRLEPPDRMKTSGIGLGLYIARSLAAAMSGELSVQTVLGEGSRFRLELPVATSGSGRLTREAPAGAVEA